MPTRRFRTGVRTSFAPTEERQHVHCANVFAGAPESGIAITMLACTFYRNFASYGLGAFYVFDVWPLVGVVDGTDFIHNVSHHNIWVASF